MCVLSHSNGRIIFFCTFARLSLASMWTLQLAVLKFQSLSRLLLVFVSFPQPAEFELELSPHSTEILNTNPGASLGLPDKCVFVWRQSWELATSSTNKILFHSVPLCTVETTEVFGHLCLMWTIYTISLSKKAKTLSAISSATGDFFGGVVFYLSYMIRDLVLCQETVRCVVCWALLVQAL